MVSSKVVSRIKVSQKMDESKLILSKFTMKKSSVARRATFSRSFVKKALVRLALGLAWMTPATFADQLYTDDVIVQASMCVGLDCVNGEQFNYDTIRLKENNVRIKFHDSSSTSSFPSNDWQITANDSGNGGANKFSIEDISATKVPFTISAGAPDHSIFVKDNGYIGFNTSTPLVQMHIKDGNSPAIRIEQDGSSGFTSQSWDIAGNETNFFIRDVTNNSNIPFKIVPGASKNALFIAGDGDIGLETQSPDGQFDVAHASDANNHAFLVNPSSYVGVNIDNGYDPLGWFDVQTTGGYSRFLVDLNGKVGLGTNTSAVVGVFDIRDYSDSSKYWFNVDNEGDIGIGTATPAGRFEVTSTAGAGAYLAVDASGNVGVGTNTPTTRFDITAAGATMLVKDSTVGTADTRNLLTIESEYGSSLTFKNRSQPTRDWKIQTNSSNASFQIARADYTSGAPALFINPNLFRIKNSANVELMSVDATSMTIAGSVYNTSSRTMKDNIVEVNGIDILDKLSELMIAKWNYTKDGEGVKHIGPIAEDFYAMFGLGKDEKHIASLDTSGVAIAAIQALNNKLKQKNQKIKELEESNKNLNERLSAIESMLDTLHR